MDVFWSDIDTVTYYTGDLFSQPDLNVRMCGHTVEYTQESVGSLGRRCIFMNNTILMIIVMCERFVHLSM